MSYIEKTVEKPDINQNPSTPSVPDTFASYYARVITAAPLREKAFVFSATVVSVPKNAIVKVIGESNGWVKFAYKGQSGWFRKNSCVVNLGDVDGNGSANSSDALAILKAATGVIKFTDAQKQVADFNGDGSVNSVDALTVLQVTTGKLKFD